MKVSEELKSYVKDLITKATSNTIDGEDAAGYANAILMATKAYGYFISIEQTMAMNFSEEKEIMNAKKETRTKN